MRSQGGAVDCSQALPSPNGGDALRRDAMQPALHEDLMERVLDSENVRRAWKRVKANKGAQALTGCASRTSPSLLVRTGRRSAKPCVMAATNPAGAIDPVHNLWRTKQGKFLFPEKALAKVFRGKWLQAIKEQGWTVKANLPRE
jgi:hypothetical protein